MKLDMFDFWKEVEMPNQVSNLEKAKQTLKEEIQEQLREKDSDENLDTETAPASGKKKRGRPPVKKSEPIKME